MWRRRRHPDIQASLSMREILQNKGIEITLNVTPVRKQDFTWSFYVNYAKNNNKVISMSSRLTGI